MAANKKLLSACLVAVLLFSCLPLLVCAEANWLEGYERRMLFYWQSSTSGQDSFIVYNQTGINQNSKFYISNETLNDFSDLTITLNDGITELSLWNQTTINGVSVKLWCNFPTANASYYLYWNNPNALTHWTLSVFDDVIDNINGAWPLDETTGASDALDYSGNSFTGTATNTDVTDSLFTGKKARTFTATSYIQLPAGASVKGKSVVSNSFWVNINALDGTEQFFWHEPTSLGNSRFQLEVFVTNFLRSGGRAPDSSGFTQWVYTNTNVAAASWLHVVCVFDSVSDIQHIYINGTDVSASVTEDAFDNSSPTSNPRIGNNNGGALGLKGAICEVLQVNGALNSTQVSHLFNGFGDPTIEAGKVYVRSWVTGNSISLFGAVESAPVVTPTVNPADVTTDDAAALAVAFGFIAIVLAIAFGVSKRR